MRVLMINKFLHPNGGSETHIFKLGEHLSLCGHQVQYFGMEHEGRCVGNDIGAYTSDMDFHNGSIVIKFVYSIKTIYSVEARKKIKKVLEDFKPDVCHLNNFNYQLTPSIIVEIVKWREKNKTDCKIVYTAHDYQLICPNHMLHNPATHTNCKKCVGGHYFSCVNGRCIHQSFFKSVVGMSEAFYWRWRKIYKYFDKIICISDFMKSELDKDKLLADKTVVIHNFIEKVECNKNRDKDYVLYFGRYSKEKGIETLMEVCKRLPRIQFVFAGKGPLEGKLNEISNVKNLGFRCGDELVELISGAKFVICPSEWYEPFGLTIIESQVLGTPVVGSDIGGIPELIIDKVNGELFESKNVEELESIISRLWHDENTIQKYSEACKRTVFVEIDEYYKKINEIYK